MLSEHLILMIMYWCSFVLLWYSVSWFHQQLAKLLKFHFQSFLHVFISRVTSFEFEWWQTANTTLILTVFGKKNSINKNNRGGRETDPLNFPIDKCYLLGLTFCHRTRAQKGLTLLACLAPQTEGASTKLGTTFCAVFSFWVSSLKKHHTPQRKLSYKIEFYNSEERAVFLGFLVKMRWKK